MKSRQAKVSRKTKETDISLTLSLDGKGTANIQTGLPFLDHLLTSLTKHSGIDLSITCKGDLEVDDHHSAEDCAIAIGQAMDEALGDRIGIQRFGYAYAPLDEALARAVCDLSGRPGAFVNLDLSRKSLGTLACENVTHVLQSMAVAMRATVHVDILRGDNDHHKAESAYKATALALKQAIALTGSGSVPSTKGSL